MSSEVKSRSTMMPSAGLFYSAESLSFARKLLYELEGELKDKAMQLTREAGRDTVTEDDMRQAADAVLGPVDGEAADSDPDNA